MIVNKDNIGDKTDVIIDQRLVSTMFLPSAAAVAKEMLMLLERNEKPNKALATAAGTAKTLPER